MLGLIIAVLVIFLGAAAVGTIVPGLFWLTVVAIAGVLVAGAVGVSMLRIRPEDDARPDVRRGQLTVVAAHRSPPQNHGSQDGGEVSRAA